MQNALKAETQAKQAREEQERKFKTLMLGSFHEDSITTLARGTFCEFELQPEREESAARRDEKSPESPGKAVDRSDHQHEKEKKPRVPTFGPRISLLPTRARNPLAMINRPQGKLSSL